VRYDQARLNCPGGGRGEWNGQELGVAIWS